jgi:rhodanese-related sulfurtransferase
MKHRFDRPQDRPVSSLTALAAAFLLGLSQSPGVMADAAGTKTIAPLKPDVPYVFVTHNGRPVRVERDAYDSLKARIDIRGMIMQQAVSCPPFCLTPMQLDIPVDTWGELEVIDFMLNQLRDESGVLVDIRNKRDYDLSTIPGSVNFFVQDIQKGPGDPNFDAMLERFGAKRRGEIDTVTRMMESVGLGDDMVTEEWDFTEAQTLVIWTSSAIVPSAETAIRLLFDAGYPASKLKWYRGGLAAWEFWGFNTVSAKR